MTRSPTLGTTDIPSTFHLNERRPQQQNDNK